MNPLAYTEALIMYYVLSTLKSLINKQGGYVVLLVLSDYLFIRDFREFRVVILPSVPTIN